MTSIPSPFDALRALLPMPGRGGDGGPLMGPGEMLEMGDGGPLRPLGPHGRGVDGHPMHSGPMRADGVPLLSPPEAAQVADLLSGAMRQNPSHPLFRELSQIPAEEFRQWVMDFLTMPSGGARDLPPQAAAPLAQATAAAAALLRENGAPQSAPPQSMAEARAEADALRATIQAQAQQTAAERAQATPGTLRAGEDGRQMAVNTALAANGAQEGRVATDARYAGLLQALAQTARAESAVPAAPNLAGSPAAAAPQIAPASPSHAAAPPDSARTLQDPAVPLMQGRTPVEAPLPARAERVAGAADPMPSGGLPGLVGAAGVTLAAVGQPAGTTFAQAPQQAVRARKSEETRDKRDKHAREAQQRDGDGDARSQSQSRERANGQGDAAKKRPPDAAATAAGGEGRTASPGAPAAAAGHTAMVAGLRPAAYAQDAEAETEDQARPGGHTAAGESSDEMTARSRRHQWLYWSLIAVTYSCLAIALGMMTPLAASLPIATESLPVWRNALTTTGLATGLWAWLLARRLR
ncbi:hypothetical protein [Luteimonas saliphila]|uniref:hypothetical protein n=1 Tax=Luteimonas saliphila TaxID=2804919 RepID=UPI00192D7D3A|nr:hypothetical protein [Luteimonas saliphila]